MTVKADNTECWAAKAFHYHTFVDNWYVNLKENSQFKYKPVTLKSFLAPN